MIDRSRQSAGYIYVHDDGDPVDPELKTQIRVRWVEHRNAGPWRDPVNQTGDCVVDFENDAVAARYGVSLGGDR